MLPRQAGTGPCAENLDKLKATGPRHMGSKERDEERLFFGGGNRFSWGHSALRIISLRNVWRVVDRDRGIIQYNNDNDKNNT